MADKNDILTMIAGGGSSYSSPEMDVKAEAKRIVAEEPPSILTGLLRSFQQGGLLGAADELEAYSTASGPDSAAVQDLTREIIREENRRFAEDSPYLSMAGNIAGSIPSALLAAPTGLFARTALGAGMGGAYGFGSGEGSAGERVSPAVIGAVTGGGAAALAPVAVKGLARGGQAALDALNQAGSVSGQRGAIGRDIANILMRKGDLRPEEALLIKALKDQSPDAIPLMRQTILEGQAQGTPLVAADVVGPRAKAYADVLANVSPEGMEIAPGIMAPRDFLDTRLMQQPGRVENLVSYLSPESTADAADAAARKIAQEANAAFEKIREANAADAYGKISTYQMTPELYEATNKPAIQGAIEYLQNDPIFAQKYAKMGVQDPRLLVMARKRAGEEARALGTSDKGLQQIKSAEMFDQRQALTDAMNAQPEFTAANAKFIEDSQPINQLFEGNQITGEAGFIAQLLETKGMTSKNAGEIILQMSPEQIEQTKTLLGDKGTKLMRAGVKSYVMDLADKTVIGTSGAERNIAKLPAKIKAITAALGEEEANKLFKKLKFEQLVTKSASRYAPGSQTAGRTAAEADLNKQVASLQNLKRALTPSQWIQTGDELLSIDDSDVTKKALAKLLFDPYSSAQFFANRGQLAQDLAARNEATGALIQYLAPKASQVGAQTTSGAANRRLKE
jgi:hypothetical protein